MVSTYSELSKKVQAAGLLERRRRYYLPRIGACALAFAGIWVGVGLLGNTWLQLILAGAFGIVVTQFAFLGHDGAHRQIFSSFRWNEWSGRVFAGLGAGLSYGWWMSKHTRHHGAPNQEGRDTDIESKVMALTPAAGLRRHGPGAWIARGQGWFFLPLLLLEGLNLHLDSFKSLITVRGVKRRWVDLSFVTVRLSVTLAVLFVLLPPGKALAFFGVQLAALGLFMGGAFAPNHTGMPIIAPGAKLDFLRRQVLMSRNISGGPLIDFFMGGLNHQIEHHLFPSMPRPNLRLVRPLVREFCEQQGVAYTETTLVGSYKVIISYLNKVGLKASDPFTCPLVAQFRN
jgi:fatty acid desaturase